AEVLALGDLRGRERHARVEEAGQQPVLVLLDVLGGDRERALGRHRVVAAGDRELGALHRTVGDAAVLVDVLGGELGPVEHVLAALGAVAAERHGDEDTDLLATAATAAGGVVAVVAATGRHEQTHGGDEGRDQQPAGWSLHDPP